MVKLDERTRSKLVAAARDAQKFSYSPYSHFQVGAAILTKDDKIYGGANIENASFGATICAERTAAVKAISEGSPKFRAVAVVTNNAVFPCGICRQFLAEFAETSDMLVIVADADGNIANETTIGVLLPGHFGPEELEDGTDARKYGTP
jgi:cytidine deaminase